MKSAITAQDPEPTFTAFSTHRRIATGSPAEVAVTVKEHLQADSCGDVLTFDDLTGKPVDLDLRGSLKVVAKRYESLASPGPDRKTGPGRPKLGVIAREVTLLPRHWEWLSTQPGGASVTLRKLVEDAKSKNQAKDRIRQAQDATYNFMTAMAGDLPGYEEALRAFYGKDFEEFKRLIWDWPEDLREHVMRLAGSVIRSG